MARIVHRVRQTKKSGTHLTEAKGKKRKGGRKKKRGY